ncbi:hypothetical protein OUZ56_011268 [Daphnia magna]|uniref:Uncharacterized protein n=1 Tax=Daphnia magna TaxID=35525 RepID=A0ABQ9YZN8_9CRUS|nr:hypothetical protein OUZ56_011268 [Daphnia magna]
MAKNKKSKTAVGSQNKRPNIRSTSVLSDTSLELPNLSDEDNYDDEPQPSTSARRTPFRRPPPSHSVDSGTSTRSSSETRDISTPNSNAFLGTPISAKKFMVDYLLEGLPLLAIYSQIGYFLVYIWQCLQVTTGYYYSLVATATGSQ